MALANAGTEGGGGGGTASPLTTKGDIYTYAGTNARLPVGSDHQVLTANSGASTGNDWEYPPGYRIGYDQITSVVNVASTTEATGTTVITGSSYTFDGTLVRCEFFSPMVRTGTVSGSQVICSLFEGSTQITRLSLTQTPAAAASGSPVFCVYYFTPSAASHTYKVTVFATSVTGTPIVAGGAGGTGGNPPAYLAFYKA